MLKAYDLKTGSFTVSLMSQEDHKEIVQIKKALMNLTGVTQVEAKAQTTEINIHYRAQKDAIAELKQSVCLKINQLGFYYNDENTTSLEQSNKDDAERPSPTSTRKTKKKH